MRGGRELECFFLSNLRNHRATDYPVWMVGPKFERSKGGIDCRDCPGRILAESRNLPAANPASSGKGGRRISSCGHFQRNAAAGKRGAAAHRTGLPVCVARRFSQTGAAGYGHSRVIAGGGGGEGIGKTTTLGRICVAIRMDSVEIAGRVGTDGADRRTERPGQRLECSSGSRHEGTGRARGACGGVGVSARSARHQACLATTHRRLQAIRWI